MHKKVVIIVCSNFNNLDKQGCIAMLAEGAIALSVTLSGGVLFAS